LTSSHREIEPAILYLGTPVVLVSTMNGDGTFNLSPMSSAWWLGWSCMLGFDASSKTVENLLRTRECVLNLPTSELASNVNRLARLTGSNPMPKHKVMMGYQYVADKFGAAGLSPEASIEVSPPRVRECHVQLEAVLTESRPFAASDPRMLIPAITVEVRIVKVHAAEAVLSDAFENRIDPIKWNPLLMSFLELFERGKRVQTSRLREIDEEAYGGRRAVARKEVTDVR
jgi:flavin reductase (DIM6/NTAB) family NADH-FMN oxidoreductase RutF